MTDVAERPTLDTPQVAIDSGTVALRDAAPPPAIAEGPGSLLNAIVQMARDPSVDVEKFERLIAIQERMQERQDARQSKREFDVAMNAVQVAMKPVFRNAENREIHSRYATLEAIDAVARPIYLEHGFSLKWGTESIEGPNIRITLDVKHTGGHVEHSYFDAPPDTLGPKGGSVKTVLHGMGSTDTYLSGRLLRKAFNIVLTNDPNDDDGNRGGMKFVSADDAEHIRLLIRDTKTNEADFLRNFFEVSEIANLSEQSAIAAKNMLVAKLRSMQKPKEPQQ